MVPPLRKSQPDGLMVCVAWFTSGWSWHLHHSVRWAFGVSRRVFLQVPCVVLDWLRGWAPGSPFAMALCWKASPFDLHSRSLMSGFLTREMGHSFASRCV